MKPVLLFASIAFGFMAVAKCFPQQPAQPSQRDAEAVVIKLYKQIVLRKPIGIPQKADRQAIWPLLSRDLIKRLDLARECEKDYFLQYPEPKLKPEFDQYPEPKLKPEFDWLEMGLFSGGNEQALPSRVAVRRTMKQKDGSYQVGVKLTYKETFETYGRPPDPKDTFNWDVIAFAIWDGNRFAVNDVLYTKDRPNEAELRLSQLLSHGCKDGKWVGASR
jgi:hypothetical protein